MATIAASTATVDTNDAARPHHNRNRLPTGKSDPHPFRSPSGADRRPAPPPPRARRASLPIRGAGQTARMDPAAGPGWPGATASAGRPREKAGQTDRHGRRVVLVVGASISTLPAILQRRNALAIDNAVEAGTPTGGGAGFIRMPVALRRPGYGCTVW
jgi:hypothetical protein